jgi:hypothetical protein
MSIFQALTRTATVEFFKGNGVEVTDTELTAPLIERAAVIGFAGAKLRGVLGIGMSDSTLENMGGRLATSCSRFDADDWLGEAANQLLGRFKNKLSRDYGVVVSMALPMVLRGVRIELVTGRAASLSVHTFQADAGRLAIWLDTEVDQNFVVSPCVGPECRSALEGELLLF